MAWLEVHQSLRTHRKVYEAADALDVSPATVIGSLVSLWLWAIDNAPKGCLGAVKPRTIARAVGWEGDAERLVSAFVEHGWLDGSDEDGLVIHDWEDYIGKLMDRREAEKERSRRRRAKSDKSTGKTASKAQPQVDRKTTGGQPADDRQTTAGTVQYSTEQYQKITDSDESVSVAAATDLPEGAKSDPVPFAEIRDLYHATAPSLRKIVSITGQRRKLVRARWKEHEDLNVFRDVFEKCEASGFLRGENDRSWTADFDWIVRPSNFPKILEGKYADKVPSAGDGATMKRASKSLDGFAMAEA